MAKLLKSFRDFSGGLSEVSGDNMENNELEYAKNAEPTERYGLRRARGTAIAFPRVVFEPLVEEAEEVEEEAETTTLTADAIVEMLEMPLIENGVEVNVFFVFAQVNDDYYLLRYDDANEAWIDASGATARPLDFFVFARKLYWLNGTKIKVYDGTEVADAVLDVGGGSSEYSNKIHSSIAVEQRGQRWFYATASNEVIFSGIGTPLAFATSSIININTNRADHITALYAFADGLLVFQTRSIHFISGWDWTSGSDVNLKKLDVASGTEYPHSIVTINNAVLFLGVDGVYLLRLPYYTDQIAAKNLSVGKIERRLKNLQINSCYAAVYDDVYYLGLNCSTGIIEYRYYIQTNAFYGEFTQGALCYLPRLRGIDKLFIGCPNGYILNYDEDIYSYINLQTGGQVAIPMEVHTKAYDVCGAMVQDAKIKRVYVCQRQYVKESSALIVQIKADYLDKAWSWELFNDESLVYAEWPNGEGIAGLWDATYWGWNDITSKQLTVNRKAKRLQFMFSATSFEDQPILILGIGVLYKRKKVKGSKTGIEDSYPQQDD